MWERLTYTNEPQQRLKVTDDNDFAQWIRPHMSAVMRVARAFAEPADQHDLMQELMICLWKARPAFRGEAQASTFVYRVAHNRALTWKRREGLRLFRFRSAHADIADMNAHADTSTEEADLQRLYAAIRTFGPIDRSLMLLSLEGTSYADIAALHGLSESNVGARLTRARAKLIPLMREANHEF